MITLCMLVKTRSPQYSYICLHELQKFIRRLCNYSAQCQLLHVSFVPVPRLHNVWRLPSRMEALEGGLRVLVLQQCQW
jgi:hypothetical protein